jgi:hypothetical protein
MAHDVKPGPDGLRRYGKWAGRPDGVKEDITLCVRQVARSVGRSTDFGQCLRKRGHGPNGEYCKAHAQELSEDVETWYCVGKYSSSIQPVQIVASTPSTVMVKSDRGPARREQRSSQYSEYFSTREAAINSIRSRLVGAVKRHEYELGEARKLLAEFNEANPQ